MPADNRVMCIFTELKEINRLRYARKDFVPDLGQNHIKSHTFEVKIITMLKIRHFFGKIFTHKEEFQCIINLKFTEKLRE
ncbi:hypothetical protein AMQ84_19230 [Paenibacillus riograndensis]|uniref:Uncharacterized protein n=1 Tax=Paenibacillus riograndensis TaxID=483937 RepID=A0A132TUM7_9BACL|nr:hypothetical protein AMQ84_19230 [Paenibacillus riograndensis]